MAEKKRKKANSTNKENNNNIPKEQVLEELKIREEYSLRERFEREKDIEFAMKMKAKLFSLETGKLVAVINEEDAKELGVWPLDRVEITAGKNSAIAILDVTDKMVKKGEVGLFEDIAKKLRLKEKDEGKNVEVNPISIPESLAFIKRKLDGYNLTEPEIKQIIKDVTKNKLTDIELSSFMTGVYINGFDLNETVYMTKALIENGKRIKFSEEWILDKHSIGGINGRVTMVVIPIIASQGYFIPKTSSRSITSAAGTADAMEVLANVDLSFEKIKSITKRVGGVICWGGALDLAPADDHIIKVEHPLSLDPEGQVVASVLAKKASVGAKYVVIDLPVGPDMKITTREKAEGMARKFIAVGKELGMKIEAIITDGTEPNGLAFGPALEARYVMEILEGKMYDNLASKSCELAGALFELVGKCKPGEGYALAKEILVSGEALKKMKEIIKAQGKKIMKSQGIKLSSIKEKVIANESGMISTINVRALANIARRAGAPADKKAGVMLFVRKGQEVNKGDVLFEIYAENRRKISAAIKYAKKINPIEMQRVVLEKFV